MSHKYRPNNLQLGGKPTRGDSLALYNNTKQLLKYYNKYVKQLETPIDKNEDVEAHHMMGRQRVESRMKLSQYPTTNRSAEDKKFNINEYYQQYDQNRYFQREDAAGILDLRAPMGLYDTRINPQSQVEYENEILGDPLRGDKVDIAMYDPIAVKPWDLLTPQERNIRIQKYGTPEQKAINSIKPSNVTYNLNNATKEDIKKIRELNNKEGVMNEEDSRLWDILAKKYKFPNEKRKNKYGLEDTVWTLDENFINNLEKRIPKKAIPPRPLNPTDVASPTSSPQSINVSPIPFNPVQTVDNGFTYGQIPPGPYSPKGGRSVYDKSGKLVGYQDSEGNAVPASYFGIIENKRAGGIKSTNMYNKKKSKYQYGGQAMSTQFSKDPGLADIVNFTVATGQNPMRNRTSRSLVNSDYTSNDKELLSYLTLFNQKEGIANMTPEQRLTSFYDTPTNNPSIQAVKDKLKNLGTGYLPMYRNSANKDIQDFRNSTMLQMGGDFNYYNNEMMEPYDPTRPLNPAKVQALQPFSPNINVAPRQFGDLTIDQPQMRNNMTAQNLGIGMKGLRTVLGEVAGRVERGRQNQYDWQQQTALGMMNPMPATDYQPNPYSLYSKYGGSLKSYMQQGGPSLRGLVPRPTYTGLPNSNYLDSFNYKHAFDDAMKMPESQFVELNGTPYAGLAMKALDAGKKDEARRYMDYMVMNMNALHDTKNVMNDTQVQAELNRAPFVPKDIVKKYGGLANVNYFGPPFSNGAKMSFTNGQRLDMRAVRNITAKMINRLTNGRIESMKHQRIK